jgi:hypothetical protein
MESYDIIAAICGTLDGFDLATDDDSVDEDSSFIKPEDVIFFDERDVVVFAAVDFQLSIFDFDELDCHV